MFDQSDNYLMNSAWAQLMAEHNLPLQPICENIIGMSVISV